MYTGLEIGPAPADEEPQQCNARNSDYTKVRQECGVYRAQLLRMFGNPPPETDLVVQFTRDGDHGYYEVAVKWHDPNRTAVEYAYNMENNAPQYWDEMALKELAEYGIPVKQRRRA